MSGSGPIASILTCQRHVRLAVNLGSATVQMIDTSIVRVHQHGACITISKMWAGREAA
jgi:hypothetical protein